ncbi:MAG: hypothetical protein OXH70_01400 [Acidobacteria bacterium]|nr:hypothetical protein [Acidobacteriota bacterium]
MSDQLHRFGHLRLNRYGADEQARQQERAQAGAPGISHDAASFHAQYSGAPQSHDPPDSHVTVRFTSRPSSSNSSTTVL